MYESELVAEQIATKLCMEVRYKARMLCVKIHGPTIMDGFIQSVIICTNNPNSTLEKRTMP